MLGLLLLALYKGLDYQWIEIIILLVDGASVLGLKIGGKSEHKALAKIT